MQSCYESFEGRTIKERETKRKTKGKIKQYNEIY